MAYNETLESMNAQLRAKTIENNNYVKRNELDGAINMAQNISNSINTLIDKKRQDLSDEATNEMLAYINSSDDYIYDSDGNLLDSTDSVMEGLNKKAEEISNKYSSFYRGSVKSTLNSTIKSNVSSIFSKYGTGIMNERKNSVNKFINNEIGLYDSGNYSSVFNEKYNKLKRYVEENPEDKEVADLFSKIDTLKSQDLSSATNDIFALTSTALFIKKCNINGMSVSQRNSTYGTDVKKNFYLRSLLSGTAYDPETGFEARVINGDLSEEEWINSVIQSEKEHGYTIDGEQYYFTSSELEERSKEYKALSSSQIAVAYANFDKALSEKNNEITDKGVGLSDFIVTLGSEEGLINWLKQPVIIDSKEVSVNERYIKESPIYNTYLPLVKNARVANELYSYLEPLIANYDNPESDGFKEAVNNINSLSPEVQLFFEETLKLKAIGDTSDDQLYDINSISPNSIFALSQNNFIGSSIRVSNQITQSIEEKQKESELDYQKALTAISEIRLNEGSYSSLLDDDELFNSITSNLDNHSKELLKEALKQENLNILYDNDSVDKYDKLQAWYTLEGKANGKQFTEEEVNKKAEELGINTVESKFVNFRQSVREDVVNNDHTQSYNNVIREITDYYENNGSYDGLSIEIIMGMDGAENLTETDISNIYTNIYTKASSERKTKKYQDLNETIKGAETELAQKIGDKDINNYNDAVQFLVDSGASKIEAEAYVYSNFAELYKQEKKNKYTESLNQIIDYVNEIPVYKEKDVLSIINQQGYNKTDIDNLLGFANLVKGGYGGKYSASEIAGSILGEKNNDSVEYIKNQIAYVNSLDTVLKGDILLNQDRSSDIYKYTLQAIRLECEETIRGIITDSMDGYFGIDGAYEYIKNYYNPNVDRKYFYEGFDLTNVVTKYMLGPVTEQYIDNYRAFEETSDTTYYSKNVKLSQRYKDDSKINEDNVNYKIHRDNISLGNEFLNETDSEYKSASIGGSLYNCVLAHIMSADSKSEAQAILASEKKFLTEDSYNNLNKIVNDMNINELLKGNGFENPMESYLSEIGGYEDKNKDSFVSYLVNNPSEFEALKKGIIDAKAGSDANGQVYANGLLKDTFTKLYSNFASSITKSSQADGILAGVSYDGYSIGSIFAGRVNNDIYSVEDSEGKINNNAGYNAILEYSTYVKSIGIADLGPFAQINANNILSGNITNLSEDKYETINSLMNIMLNTDQNYSNNMIETCALAVSLIYSNYNINIDFNRLVTDDNYYKQLQNNILLGYKDINDYTNGKYSAAFSTAMNTSAKIVKSIYKARDYKSNSSNFLSEYQFDGFDNNGNIVLSNGKIIAFEEDIGGDIKSMSILNNENDSMTFGNSSDFSSYDTSNKNAIINNLGLHNKKSTSDIVKGLNIDTKKINTESYPSDAIEKLNTYNKEEYDLKGDNANIILLSRRKDKFSNSYIFEFKKVTLETANKIIKNGNEYINYYPDSAKFLF